MDHPQIWGMLCLLKLNSTSDSARRSWNLEADALSPYNSFTTIKFLLHTFLPTSEPAVIKTSSLVFPYKKAFPIS
jgi:hypothetical protein